MSGNTIVAATADGLLTAMERATGAPRWQIRLPGAARVLAVGPTAAYVGLGTGTLCSYAIGTGGERWCFPLRIPLSGAPIIDGDRVRVVLLDNSLRTFDRQSGSMQQPLSLGHRPAAGPWVTPSSIVVALTTGEFVVIDPQSNRILARLPVPGGSASHLLDGAAIGTDGRSMASVTIATSGERRLSVYRPLTSPTLPVLTPPPALPFPSVPLPLP
jgi:outer membrane protein assembly factor BamB